MSLPRHRLRVYYEDTDLGGIVYHANYLRFMERGRTEALLALGIDQVALKAETGIVFAVRRMAVDYLAPARFQDLLDVSTRVTEIGGSRILLEQAVLRDGAALVRAEVVVVCLGADGRPRRVPEGVRNALGEINQRANEGDASQSGAPA